jgi:hypothetical protein
MQRPVEVTWGAGSYGEETGKLGTWHWCSAAREIALVNSSTTPAHVRITLGISTGHAKPARFIIKGPGISDTVPVIDSIRPLAYTLDLPPGKNVFNVRTTRIAGRSRRARPLYASGQPMPPPLLERERFGFG